MCGKRVKNGRAMRRSLFAFTRTLCVFFSRASFPPLCHTRLPRVRAPPAHHVHDGEPTRERGRERAGRGGALRQTAGAARSEEQTVKNTPPGGLPRHSACPLPRLCCAHWDAWSVQQRVVGGSGHRQRRASAAHASLRTIPSPSPPHQPTLPSTPQQPQIILLREGTDTSQGTPQLVSNINACAALADTVRTTLGPRGADKLIHDSRGNVTISNDGATIMKLLEVVHPAAKTLVDISLGQDAEVGDGTTTVVLLAGELLRCVKPFVEDGVHPSAIAAALRSAGALAGARLTELAVPIATARSDPAARAALAECAGTSLNSKLVSGERDFFAGMVVDAVLALDPDTLDLACLGIHKVQGGGLRDSSLVDGVAFKKTFAYAGFEMQPKRVAKPAVLCLNVELELKSEKDNAEVRLTDPSDYQSIVDAEWNIIYAKLASCADAGATVVLSRLAIGDLATQWFAGRGIVCAGRVPAADMDRVLAATGASLASTTRGLTPDVLGRADVYEEKQVGDARFSFLTGCPSRRTATLILRGGSPAFVDEAERSLHDAIMVVRRAVKTGTVVAGGGAVDMELSR